MKHHWSWKVVPAFCLALVALQCAQPVPDTRAADEAAIRAINPVWFRSYNAGHVDSIVALYAEDAVVNPPGSPAVRGAAAIREYFAKDVAGAASAGVTLQGGATSDVDVSGNIGWEAGTFTVTDKSGTIVDKGKFVSVCARRNGKWVMVRDIWNSDGPMQAAEKK